ncbi:MAG: putative enoyl-CoA hydratase [Acidimicrobiia bacterium]|nr:putative enoyl-CoA hydratase [Acidimicrobiia bacterium]
MPDEQVLLERRSDGVAVVTLNNPKVNALSTAVLARLAEVAEALTDDPPGAVVITGGPRLFGAGADITQLSGPDEARVVGTHFLRALNAVAAIPRMVIASVSGFALGGACEVTLACDLRIASTRAKFGLPEVSLGVIPGGGGTQRLARLVGPARAKDLICSGRQITAAEALRIGLVDEVVEPEELDARVMERAVQFASGAVLAQALIKEAVDEGLSGTLHEGLLLEQDSFEAVFRTRDARHGVESFLAQGAGKAVFEGR